jgi:hypothetical protein
MLFEQECIREQQFFLLAQPNFPMKSMPHSLSVSFVT